MHVYFYAPRTKQSNLWPTYQQINDVLKQTEIFISTNIEAEPVQVSPELLAASQTSNVPLLEQMNAFIIEGSTSDPEVGFLLAHAIALKKPTLYLYRRGIVPQIFSRLNQREIPPFIKVVAYETDKVANPVLNFLKSITGLNIREVPRIKFTLRITNTIEQYLNYKTLNTKISKADYLRAQIEQKMEQDDDWKKYQHQR